MQPSLIQRLARATALCTLLVSHAFADTTIKFLNDWRWEGQAARWLVANKGYFQAEKLNVTLTPGTGSGTAVTKVASGEFDMGLGDLSSPCF